MPETERPTQLGKIFPPSEEWLAKAAPESPRRPELAIVDAHHHLWDRPGKHFLPSDLRAEIAEGQNVVDTVFVECLTGYRTDGPQELRPVGETEWVVSATASEGADTRIARGIVGFADLRLGHEVRPVLEAHLEAGQGRFKGVRFATAWDASNEVENSHTGSEAGLLDRPDVVHGLQELSTLGLTFDAMVLFPQLDDVARLADTMPDLSVVLGHCGGPLGHGPYGSNKDEHFARWQRGIRELARRPNVVCKLGGILVRGAAFDYTTAATPPSSRELADLWRPWILTCIEEFGADRCMFESNFPVEKVGIGYTALWNTFVQLTRDASAADRHALFAGTAKRIYGL